MNLKILKQNVLEDYFKNNIENYYSDDDDSSIEIAFPDYAKETSKVFVSSDLIYKNNLKVCDISIEEYSWEDIASHSKKFIREYELSNATTDIIDPKQVVRELLKQKNIYSLYQDEEIKHLALQARDINMQSKQIQEENGIQLDVKVSGLIQSISKRLEDTHFQCSLQDSENGQKFYPQCKSKRL